MDARATLNRSQSSTRILGMFVASVLGALILGGAGGYLLRDVSAPSPGTITNDQTHPVVVEQAPYQAPSPSPLPQPIYDPKGNSVPY